MDPWAIAKELRVDGKTVKLRIRRMEKIGFIKYYQIYPNYRLLGLEGEAAYIFEVRDMEAKYKAMEKVSLLDRVDYVFNFLGNALCVGFAYHDSKDHDKNLQLLEELTGCSSSLKFSEVKMPPIDITLNNIDWTIIRNLRHNAFKRLSQVADEIGVTTKTVTKRFEIMVSKNAFEISPVINPGRASDTITYAIIFFLEEDGRKDTVRRILDKFQSTCFLNYTPPTGHIMLCNFCRTLGEIEDALLLAKSIEGVSDARLFVPKELKEYSEWVDREIEKKIEETKHR